MDTTNRIDNRAAGSPLVGIIMATRMEAEPFFEALRLQELGKNPLAAYGRGRVILSISGIGKVNAAIATTYCCTSFHPDWILNLGAAGATGTSWQRGDICHITRIVEFDRPRFGSKEPHIYLPEVLPGFHEATLATQDRPVIEGKDRKAVSPFADLADMEGAAVARAARRFGTRCALFKFVSDTPDDLHGNDIIACIRDYRTAFCRFVSHSVLPRLD